MIDKMINVLKHVAGGYLTHSSDCSVDKNGRHTTGNWIQIKYLMKTGLGETCSQNSLQDHYLEMLGGARQARANFGDEINSEEGLIGITNGNTIVNVRHPVC